MPQSAAKISLSSRSARRGCPTRSSISATRDDYPRAERERGGRDLSRYFMKPSTRRRYRRYRWIRSLRRAACAYGSDLFSTRRFISPIGSSTVRNRGAGGQVSRINDRPLRTGGTGKKRPLRASESSRALGTLL